MAHLYFAGSKGGSFQNLLSRKALPCKQLKCFYNMKLVLIGKKGQKFQTSELIQVSKWLFDDKSVKMRGKLFCNFSLFPILDLLMVVARIFLRIKAKNDGWGGVRRISNILGQILVHYYCCIGTKPSFHGAIDSISNLSYLIFIWLV